MHTHILYLSHAFGLAYALSKSKRKKVGALLVNASFEGVPQILSDGVNGTRPGDSVPMEFEDGTTNPVTRHAERNCLLKLPSRQQAFGGTLYVTVEPCLGCAQIIEEHRLKRVIYCFDYKDHSGIEYLQSVGIEVLKVDYDAVSGFFGIMANNCRSDYDISGALREQGLSEEEINRNVSHSGDEDE